MAGKKSIIDIALDIVLVVLVGGLLIVSVGTLLAFWIAYWNDLLFYVVLLLGFCAVAPIYLGLWAENHKNELDTLYRKLQKMRERHF